MTEIIVPSCLRYRDTWAPIHGLLAEHWQDCPWPVRIVTDLTPGDSPDFGPFEQGYGIMGDRGWCGNLTAALRGHDARAVILLWQDDLFPTRRVMGAAVEDAARWMWAQPEVGCLRLYPCPGPLDGVERERIGGVPYGECAHGEPYRVSCQVALWRVNYLRRALACGRTAAEFELAGSAAAREWPERVLSVLRAAPEWPVEYLCSGISRGRWTADAARLLRARGHGTGARPVEP